MSDPNDIAVPAGQPGALPGTFAGWANNFVNPSASPPADIPLTQVPGVLAGLPGALVNGGSGANAGPAVPTSAEAPVSPGGTSDFSGNDAELQSVAEQQRLRDYLVNPGSGKGPQAFYRPQGSDYSGFGGEEGKKRFDQAYDQRAGALEGAIRDSGAAQQEKAGALSKFYNEQAERDASAAAAARSGQESAQRNIAQRQRTLDQATTQYTDDLNNTGKFWSNPGNIIAAISFSLMPAVSSDPAIGAKLINQAIQQDLSQRQHAAGQVLGALQSNLHGYMKIAEDEQAGQLLAQSEAHRIAAQEVERTGAMFESRISRAKTEAIAQDLRQKQDLLRAEAYNKIINQPAARMERGLFDARGQGYEGAWSKYGNKDVAPLTIGRAVQGDIAGTPSTATDSKNGGYSAHVAPSTIAIINASPDPTEAAARAAQEGRLPGSANIAAALRASVAREALSANHGVGYGPSYDAAKYKIVNAAEENIKEVSGQLTPLARQRSSLQGLLRDASIIEKSEAINGRDPKDFLGKARAVFPESVVLGYEQLERSFRGPPANKAEALENYKRDAVAQFRQRLSGQISVYYNAISGGAISPTELPRLQASISGASDFNYAHNWLKGQSTTLGAQEKEALKALTPIGRLLYMTQTGIGQSTNINVKAPSGPKPPPQGNGEYSGGRSVSSGGAGYSGYVSRPDGK